MIRIIGKKTLYNLDNSYAASDWVLPIQKYKKVNVVPLTSGVKIGNNPDAKMNEGYLGGLVNCGNNVKQNAQVVAILNSRFNDKCTKVVDIMPENFTKALSLFSTRKLVMPNWINDKDEYLAPDETHPDYVNFINECLIFSTFHIHSNSASLRNMDYKKKKWDIKNEFFWLSKQEIADLAQKNNNKDCYDDAISSDERFVYKYLQNVTLSPEAQAVLDYANKLVHESFKYREQFNKDHPEYQINNWDCGYYQLKALWKEYMPEEFAEFRSLYNKLADKMRPMVYELGFLKK